MILTTKHDCMTYAPLSERLQTAFLWLRTTDFQCLPDGKTPIRGDDVFCSLMRYTTKVPSQRVWEGHKRYIDIHFMVDGAERVDVSPIKKMSVEIPYNETTDFMQFTGEVSQSILLCDDFLLIAYPEDIHRTALHPFNDQPLDVRKGIVKVLL